MPYPELLKKLYYSCRAKKTPYGLENIKALDRALGSPSKAYPTIHIGGTNGKGSVSTKVATALSLHGLKVGLFTSPHLLSFRERIRVQGVPIEEERAVALLERLFKLQETLKIEARFFEMTTALALLYFLEEKVDVAVFEVGLGGRRDATNLLHPLVSAITSIGMDHEEMLGSTLEQIAYEKAGILKKKTPAVIGPTVPLSVVAPIATTLEAPLYPISTSFAFFDDENQAIASQVLSLLPWKLDPKTLQKGLLARPLCRFFEVDHPKGPLLFDVAHNPPAFKKLFHALSLKYPHTRLHTILGMTRRQGVPECLELALSASEKVWLTEGFSEKEVASKDLLALAPSSGHCQTAPIEGLIEMARSAAPKDHLLLITGSCFLMGPLLKQAGFALPEDPLILRERF